MLNENAKKWVAALRSGQFKQAKHSLKTSTGYCCLGVACHVLGEEVLPLEDWEDEVELSHAAAALLGLRTTSGAFTRSLLTNGGYQSSLTGLNDHGGKTFAEIADIIESEPEGLFI